MLFLSNGITAHLPLSYHSWLLSFGSYTQIIISPLTFIFEMHAKSDCFSPLSIFIILIYVTVLIHLSHWIRPLTSRWLPFLTSLVHSLESTRWFFLRWNQIITLHWSKKSHGFPHLTQNKIQRCFLWLSNIPLCMCVDMHVCVCVCVPHIFIHSSVNGHLGCFHVLAIVNSDVIFKKILSTSADQIAIIIFFLSSLYIF